MKAINLKKVGRYKMQKCKSCGGNSFVKVPEFEKELTACLDCGEVVSIRFVNPSILKKYINPDHLK
ncbi:hypothetical protein QTG56_10920 [Rossellomorea sp. AcN35-11]|nr:hypothetical protein [Rossellomorea aquimaris]NMH67914.1 hypothetical protein [Bacillus sp. RO3]WJV31387.1 hypothetical protein QTG56_10920 [Rossellomorea sp. AcN35-11]